ncbi:7723_t:CDS:2 [Paraglomus brasilianum]|uniref:7723_t:CDS:1 n=1 Tax=Paraglomus brasilianum TaxID=144538 RepID=A0A9N9A9L9_9GLOM|nr:7723_t:CDS:2 [Paraglomus brasilianum]
MDSWVNVGNSISGNDDDDEEVYAEDINISSSPTPIPIPSNPRKQVPSTAPLRTLQHTIARLPPDSHVSHPLQSTTNNAQPETFSRGTPSTPSTPSYSYTHSQFSTSPSTVSSYVSSSYFSSRPISQITNYTAYSNSPVGTPNSVGNIILSEGNLATGATTTEANTPPHWNKGPQSQRSVTSLKRLNSGIERLKIVLEEGTPEAEGHTESTGSTEAINITSNSTNTTNATNTTNITNVDNTASLRRHHSPTFTSPSSRRPHRPSAPSPLNPHSASLSSSYSPSSSFSDRSIHRLNRRPSSPTKPLYLDHYNHATKVKPATATVFETRSLRKRPSKDNTSVERTNSMKGSSFSEVENMEGNNETGKEGNGVSTNEKIKDLDQDQTFTLIPKRTSSRVKAVNSTSSPSATSTAVDVKSDTVLASDSNSLGNFRSSLSKTAVTQNVFRGRSSGSASPIPDDITIAPIPELDDIRGTYNHYKYTEPKDLAMYQYAGRVDRFGFIISGEDEAAMLEIDKRYELRECKRSLKWARWLATTKYIQHSGKYGSTSYVFPSNKKFSARIQKGIPDSWRNLVWYYLVANGADAEFDETLAKTYHTLLLLNSPHERQIDLDVPRTTPSHIMFMTRYGPGQQALFNVLRAFSVHDKQVGYCQGMAAVCAILLMYYPEETAFIMLIKLFNRYNLHHLFVPGFPALLESFYVQEQLMNTYIPKIFAHFVNLNVLSNAYATRWYITLFAGNVVPHHTVLRIWDLMMLHGFDVLYFVAIAVLQYHQATLLASDFENVMRLLSNSLDVKDDDKLICNVKCMYGRRGRKKLVETLKADYRANARGSNITEEKIY